MNELNELTISLAHPENYELLACLKCWQAMACAGFNSLVPERLDIGNLALQLTEPNQQGVLTELYDAQLTADRVTVYKDFQANPIEFCADTAGKVWQLMFTNQQYKFTNQQYNKHREFTAHIVIEAGHHPACLGLKLAFSVPYLPNIPLKYVTHPDLAHELAQGGLIDCSGVLLTATGSAVLRAIGDEPPFAPLAELIRTAGKTKA